MTEQSLLKIIDVGSVLGPAANYAYLRRKVLLPASGRGELLLAARQYAMVWVNGVYVGQTFERAHEDELRWRRFDLTPYLTAGENVVAVLVHRWLDQSSNAPGVAILGQFLLAAGGEIGDEDLAEGWRIAEACEYRPARRHNTLIGHEELRDLRLEPAGWKRAGFDDRAWRAAVSQVPQGIRPVPSPLRALREQQVVPSRIVRQGRLIPGMFATSPAPDQSSRWRLAVQITQAQAYWFCLLWKMGDRLWLDGEEISLPMEPPFNWTEDAAPIRLKLSEGGHVLEGQFRADTVGRPLLFGWKHQIPTQPAQGEIEWVVDADQCWKAAREASRPAPGLVPLAYDIEDRPGATLAADGTLEVTATGDEPTCVLLEFPANCTVLPRLEFADATAGAEVELVYAERLSQVEGMLLPAAYAYTDRAILREGRQRWDISFQYKSARVLMVILRPRGGMIRLQRVTATYRCYDHAATARMESSDARLDRIWEISRHTVEMGSQDLMVDGPWREQLLYMGDILVAHQAAYLLFANAHEITEWAHTLFARGQREDGLFQPNQPCRVGPEQDRLLDQVVLWPIELEQHRTYTGRCQFVRELLPSMVRLMDGFDTLFGRSPSQDPRLRGLTGWNWVDHPGLENGCPRSIRHEGIPTAINLLYLLALQSSVRLLRAENCSADADRLQLRIDQLSRLLKEHHWDGRRQVFVDCVVDGKVSPEVSVHVNLLAIEAGLADEPGDLLDRTWNRPDVLQICGSFFRYHLFEVLHRLDRRQMLLDEMRSWWGGMVDAGLTSLSENMPVNGEWGSSVGHPWGATPCIHLVRSIAGLEPLEPGWKRVRCNPCLGDLDHLSTTVPTPYGPIDASVRKALEGVEVCLRAPREIQFEAGHAVRLKVHPDGPAHSR